MTFCGRATQQYIHLFLARFIPVQSSQNTNTIEKNKLLKMLVDRVFTETYKVLYNGINVDYITQMKG